MIYNEIYDFWFKELTPADWFKKNDELDSRIYERFKSTHECIIKGEYASWRSSAQGALAEIIVLDQFSRNIFRNQAQAFLWDSLSLALAQEAIRRGDDKELNDSEKSFLYMPFMHSESKLIHEEAVKFFSQPGLEGNLDFELKHKVIIDRFGRYPHRNEVLGRDSTLEEIEFLKSPGSSF